MSAGTGARFERCTGMTRFPLLLLSLALPTALAAQTAVAPKPVTVGDVAGKPLDDLNLRKGEIAPALESALAAPYRLPGKGTCPQLRREIVALDAALGPDIDAATDQTTAQKRAEAVGGTAKTVVGSLIPFGGIIREVTGANATERRRQVYLYAGSVRRAFLKGYGTAHGCGLVAKRKRR